MQDNNGRAMGYKAPAVQKGINIVKLVAAAHAGMGISEIAAALAYSKSTTSGLAQALVAEGVLNQDPATKRFFLGPALLAISLKHWNYLKFNKKAAPLLASFRDRMGESVFLGVRSDDRALVIAAAESQNPYKISAPVGATFPLFAGVIGKIFLSLLDDTAVRALMNIHGLPCFTDRSICDPDKYLTEIQQVRQRGYALDREEYMPGVRAVAASLRNLRGLPLGIWVVGFNTTLTDTMLSHIAREIVPFAESVRCLLDDGDQPEASRRSVMYPQPSQPKG